MRWFRKPVAMHPLPVEPAYWVFADPETDGFRLCRPLGYIFPDTFLTADDAEVYLRGFLDRKKQEREFDEDGQRIEPQ